MAFIPSASTVTLTARLTPYGRQQLLANTNSVISHFSLGDSDANYRTSEELQSGFVPSSTGAIGSEGTFNNSVTNNVIIRNKILVNNSGITLKSVEVNSNSINSTQVNLGLRSVQKEDLSGFTISRLDYLTDPNTNLFSSFGLPITEASQNLYNNVSDAFGGFANTALNGLNQDKVLIVSVDGSDFGEMIDGRIFKMVVTTSSGGTFTLYSTYQKTLMSSAVQDTKTSESSPKSQLISNNIAFLFSDDIQRPNNNVSKSWSTGYNTVKPFSVNKKELFNLTTNTSINSYADSAVGIIYLDKGIVVITEPSIVNTYANGDFVSTEFNSIVTEVSQDITCIVNRGEFNRSVNPTYNVGDNIRVSEVGLHDTNGNLMALAKTNKQILIGANQFVALGIKISV